MSSVSRLLTAAAACLLCLPALAETAASGPPAAAVKPVTDDYFGTQVVDPYRWMETPNSPELADWMKAQNDYTHNLIGRIPGRDGLYRRLEELSNAGTTVYQVQPVGGEYFYYKLAPGMNTPKLYVRHGTAGAERLLVDADTFGDSGVHHAIDYFVPSWDGKYVAYGISSGGSEQSTLYVLETASGRDLGVHVSRAVFGALAWRTDDKSFFYFRLREPQPGDKPGDKFLRGKSYLHELGQHADGEGDPAVAGFEVNTQMPIRPDQLTYLVTSPASGYVLAVVQAFVKNEFSLYAAPASSVGGGKTVWRKIADEDDDVTQASLHGDQVYLLTHKDASRFKILETSLAHPDLAHAKAVVPEGKQTVIIGMGTAKDALYVQSIEGGLGRVLKLAYTGGKPKAATLPYDGAISEFVTDPALPGVLMKMTSWTEPQLWYQYDPVTDKATDTGLRARSPVDYSQIESREVLVKSYDGTEVPLSIILKKGMTLDGSHPTLLSGYGAYGIRQDPGFSPTLLAWLERGGIFAVAHVRGGGEYGEDWHQAGMKDTKLNTVLDFIATAQYLVDQRYTDSTHLGIQGGSAGGLTVGGAITQRPQLFAAALDDVPASDMLRMETTPNGPTNIPEYGSVTTPDGFIGLYAMSPYAHVRDGAPYPAVMLTTGANDPRVAPWQVTKMAARLQAASGSGKPVLLRVDYDAGHGIGSTKSQQDAETADEWAFLLWQFGDPDFQPK